MTEKEEKPPETGPDYICEFSLIKSLQELRRWSWNSTELDLNDGSYI